MDESFIKRFFNGYVKLMKMLLKIMIPIGIGIAAIWLIALVVLVVSQLLA